MQGIFSLALIKGPEDPHGYRQEISLLCFLVYRELLTHFTDLHGIIKYLVKLELILALASTI